MTRSGESGVVKWHVDLPQIENQSAFPFLIGDDTPRSLRVKEVDAGYHPNGATGIRSITVAVSDPSKVLPFYDTLLSGIIRNQTTDETTYSLNGSTISIIRNDDKTKSDGPVNIELKKGDGKTLSLRGLSL
jgi:hypothetical protein